MARWLGQAQKILVTCWLVLAAAANCRRGIRCSRHPCSGPCTWRCISAGGEGARLSSGPTQPHTGHTDTHNAPNHGQRTARAQQSHRTSPLVRACAETPRRCPPATHRDPPRPTPAPKASPAPNCPGSPPASRYTSGSTCPSSSVGTCEPSIATPAPWRTPPPSDPGPTPDLQQLLRVGHSDLHLHLLHDEPRVQLAAARAPEIRAEATLHGSAKLTSRGRVRRPVPAPEVSRPWPHGKWSPSVLEAGQLAAPPTSPPLPWDLIPGVRTPGPRLRRERSASTCCRARIGSGASLHLPVGLFFFFKVFVGLKHFSTCRRNIPARTPCAWNS